MATGTLKVQTYLGIEHAIPVAGARVQILSNEGMVLYNLITNQDGETQYVELETLPKDLSLSPGYYHPYLTYDVVVELEGYNTVKVHGVQIFDGIASYEPVTMTPIAQNQTTAGVDQYYITDTACETDEQREQPGGYEDVFAGAGLSRTLRKVIIPRFIRVKLGAPTSNAQVVTVPYIDYIKNVASSEIFPTWPDASLRANIYAIMTFTLNRVFTEWYRSRGHNFHITSSTAVDQKYIHGRNIFESISRIVDEIWNEYVVRAGRIEPFFTSYCNGTTATCSGLSQWGTVTLANQGRTPIQILRHFYPNDVQIVQSLIFADIPESYPGAALRLGATGQNVELIQRYLNRIRRNFPGIPVISNVNGVFDQETLNAVRAFQRTFNLAQDGVVGPATWYQIVRIYVAVTNLAALNSEGTQIGITNTPPSSTLQQGSRGLDVVTLQYVLSFLSEFYAQVPAVTQNGVFDLETADGVRAFQRFAGLPVTGVVNQATWNKLWEFYWGVINNAPPQIGGGGSDNSEVVTHVVQAGDTLWLLARQYGTTVEAIRNLNNLTSDNLNIGQRLLMPTSYPQTNNFNYTVQAGDTLWLLAQRFGTTVEAIRVLNNLTSDTLLVGQVLRIPGEAQDNTTSYTVRAGDSLWLIAQRFGTTVEAIMNANHMTSSAISPGQVITIPGAYQVYTVRAGDTLFLLAMRFGTTVANLMQINNLTSSELRVGQELLVPGA